MNYLRVNLMKLVESLSQSASISLEAAFTRVAGGEARGGKIPSRRLHVIKAFYGIFMTTSSASMV